MALTTSTASSALPCTVRCRSPTCRMTSCRPRLNLNLISHIVGTGVQPPGSSGVIYDGPDPQVRL